MGSHHPWVRVHCHLWVFVVNGCGEGGCRVLWMVVGHRHGTLGVPHQRLGGGAVQLAPPSLPFFVAIVAVVIVVVIAVVGVGLGCYVVVVVVRDLWHVMYETWSTKTCMWPHCVTWYQSTCSNVMWFIKFPSIPGLVLSGNPQDSLQSSGMYPHRTGKIGWHISQYSVLGLGRNPQESRRNTWGTIKSSVCLQILTYWLKKIYRTSWIVRNTLKL